MDAYSKYVNRTPGPARDKALKENKACVTRSIQRRHNRPQVADADNAAKRRMPVDTEAITTLRGPPAVLRPILRLTRRPVGIRIPPARPVKPEWRSG
jgi:hypothetical protein